MLASCGYDRHISLWNINSFEHIGGLQVSQENTLHYKTWFSFQGRGTWLQDIHFGKDSKWVITCSKVGAINLKPVLKE